MSRPVLLDAYCGAGGAGMGYHRAGFTVIGVDIRFQRSYPFAFITCDALEAIVAFTAAGLVDAVHASPPCQAHTSLKHRTGKNYVDLVPATRDALEMAGVPYIIENVVGAPLINPVMLCGAMFPELRVYRHRLFEANFDLVVPDHPAHTAKVYTHDKRKAHYGQPIDDSMFIQVTGGGNAPAAEKYRAMGGIDWMRSREEVNQAIPPAYTELLGRQMRKLVTA